MPERKLRPIDWKKTDNENFSELMAQGFAERNMEYLPGGLVLKRPKPVDDKYGSTEIQVIGIPFRNVFGQTKFRYHRVTLSGFEQTYKQLLGSEISPIRIEIDGSSDEKVMEDTKKFLAKRLDILPQRFILELVEKRLKENNKPQYKYKFYFSIPESNFTDATAGLSIINDKDAYIYVEGPNIRIENGQGVIQMDDMTSVLRGTESSVYHADPYNSNAAPFPREYNLIEPKIGEDFGISPENKILYEPPGGIFIAKVGQDLLAHASEISVTGNSTYKNGIVESRFKFAESPTLKIKTVFGGQYETKLSGQIERYRGPNVIDPLGTQSLYVNSSVASAITSLEPKQSAPVYYDELGTINNHAVSSIGIIIVSTDFAKMAKVVEEKLSTPSLQATSSISIRINSSGQ